MGQGLQAALRKCSSKQGRVLGGRGAGVDQSGWSLRRERPGGGLEETLLSQVWEPCQLLRLGMLMRTLIWSKVSCHRFLPSSKQCSLGHGH